LTEGQFTTLDASGALIGLPGTLPTSLRGINPRGQIVGYYVAPPGSSADCVTASSVACIKGLLYKRGRFSTVLFPGHPGAIPQRIAPSGDIYGCYHDYDLMGSMHGFVRTPSGYTGFDVPASMHYGATPDGSMIVGLYTDMMTGRTHGYMLNNGNFEPFDVPGSILTQIWDIDPAEDNVGSFRDNTGKFHGFLQTAGGNTPIDYPGAVATQALGINPDRAIVGQYTDTSGKTRGFLAVPAGEDSEVE
jgi:hypothetical protein